MKVRRDLQQLSQYFPFPKQQGESTELSRIMGELDVGDTGGEEQDLLDLMDSAK